MKEEQIKNILQKHKLSYEAHGSICGTIKASEGAYNNGLGNMMHTMKDHVIHIGQSGVAIIAIDDNRGSLKEDTLTYFPKEHIRSINIKMKLFNFRLLIVTDKGEVQYKIRRSALGAPWHKQNLSYLLLKQLQC